MGSKIYNSHLYGVGFDRVEEKTKAVFSDPPPPVAEASGDYLSSCNCPADPGEDCPLTAAQCRKRAELAPQPTTDPVAEASGERDGDKIIAGLQDAIAFTRGDETRGRIVTPQPTAGHTEQARGVVEHLRQWTANLTRDRQPLFTQDSQFAQRFRADVAAALTAAERAGFQDGHEVGFDAGQVVGAEKMRDEVAQIVRNRACGYMSLPSNAIFNAGLIVEDLSRIEQRIRALAARDAALTEGEGR